MSTSRPALSFNNRPETALIRIDKNVGKNVLDFTGLGTDAPLVKSLIYYFCHTYQYNLFNWERLDPYDFARRFGFTTNHLRKRHPDPVQLKGLSQTEIDDMYALQEKEPEMRIWDSYLENALWILKTSKINYRYGGKVYKSSEEKMYYSEVKDIQFLEELAVIFSKNSRGGKERISYHYKLADSFVENLTNYYFKASADSIMLLRKPALDDLYIYLINLLASLKGAANDKQLTHDSSKEIIATPAFSLLCELAHINVKSAKQRKYKLNGCLQRIARETDLKFTVEWVKANANTRYNYKPILRFPLTTNINSEGERDNIFYQKVVHELMKVYRKKYVYKVEHSSTEDKFLTWCRKNEDVEAKVLAFQYAYFDTWRTTVEKSHYSTKQFMQQLRHVQSIAEIYQIKWRYLD